MSQGSDTLSLRKNCSSCGQKLVRNGHFFRKSDSKFIARWRCLVCGKTASQATGTPCFGQNKRRINDYIRKQLPRHSTQRGLAEVLGVNRKTIARKQKFLAGLAAQKLYLLRQNLCKAPLERAQFDEMETFEHTKMKPLSIAVAVCAKSRLIIDLQVSSMPCKGLLAKKSRKKYGKRKDGRKAAMKRLFKNISPVLHPHAELLSDKNPKYGKWLREVSNTWIHKTVKGRRGCIVGSGELKVGGFDPLFSLNHTCAMIRAGVSRLIRKTWTTTKKPEKLVEHLLIYVEEHNRRIIEKFS